jgi:Lecithin retinol acyltransferase
MVDLRVATNDPPSAERHLYSLGDHLRVRRCCYRHHGIYVGADRVVQFGGVLTDKPHSGIDEVGLQEFHRGDRVEIVPKQQKWLGLWDLPPALPPEEIVRRARWLADRRFEGTYNLVGRNCETAALWCVCNMGESLQRQRFQAVNAYLGAVVGLAYAYLHGQRRVPVWATRAILASLAVRLALLVMYYRHNARFYRDVRPYYTEHTDPA